MFYKIKINKHGKKVDVMWFIICLNIVCERVTEISRLGIKQNLFLQSLRFTIHFSKYNKILVQITVLNNNLLISAMTVLLGINGKTQILKLCFMESALFTGWMLQLLHSSMLASFGRLGKNGCLVVLSIWSVIESN